MQTLSQSADNVLLVAHTARAHPYVLSHLAAHALKADIIGELVADGMFIASADPLRMLRALAASTDPFSRQVYACYSLAFDRLRDQSVGIRLSYLEMTARQRGHDALAETWARDGVPRPWSVPWARWSPVTPRRTIWAHGYVASVAVGTLDGRSVIVSGGEDSVVRLWNAQGVALSEVHIGSNVNELTLVEPGTVVVGAKGGLLVIRFANPGGVAEPTLPSPSRRTCGSRFWCIGGTNVEFGPTRNSKICDHAKPTPKVDIRRQERTVRCRGKLALMGTGRYSWQAKFDKEGSCI